MLHVSLPVWAVRRSGRPGPLCGRCGLADNAADREPRGLLRLPAPKPVGWSCSGSAWGASRSAFSWCHARSWGQEAAGWPDHCLRGRTWPVPSPGSGRGFFRQARPLVGSELRLALPLRDRRFPSACRPSRLSWSLVGNLGSVSFRAQETGKAELVTTHATSSGRAGILALSRADSQPSSRDRWAVDGGQADPT